MSMFPTAANGAVEIRSAAGVCAIPASVECAYCPPATLTATGAFTALPSDCTARITPAQINGIVSELLALAEAFDPDGNITIGGTGNVLATAFNNYLTDPAGGAATQVSDVFDNAGALTPDQFAALDPANGGTGTPQILVRDDATGTIYTVDGVPLFDGQDTADALCADQTALNTLNDCLNPDAEVGAVIRPGDFVTSATGDVYVNQTGGSITPAAAADIANAGLEALGLQSVTSGSVSSIVTNADNSRSHNDGAAAPTTAQISPSYTFGAGNQPAAATAFPGSVHAEAGIVYQLLIADDGSFGWVAIA